jgi:biopolymer transport protein ExbB
MEPSDVLTEHLLGFTLMGAEWILWILVALSLLSIALIFERVVYFALHRLPTADEVVMELLKGNTDAVASRLGEARGLQAAVVRAGLANLDAGADAVEQIIAATVSRERKHYERGLAFLGTLGSNAPFIGLFGTVLGIIKAFHELSQATGHGAQAVAGGAPQVMAGISEALVATAVGLMVAIPAVVAFNAFNRWLTTLSASANELGYALIARLRSASGDA